MDMQTMIETIIEIEWEMFQHTDNIGGRASCQDDFETFYIMRGSQYANWTDEMRECWLSFLKKKPDRRTQSGSRKIRPYDAVHQSASL